MISEYAKGLECRVKERYSQKISVIGVDPATIPAEQKCKYVVRARVRHSQRMNDPLVNIWVISPGSFPKTMGLFCQSIASAAKPDWPSHVHISRVCYFIQRQLHEFMASSLADR